MNFKILIFLDFILGGLWLLLLKLRRRKLRHADQEFDRIVVLKFIGNGSLVSSAPSLYAIKRRYSGAKMHLYTTGKLVDQVKILKIFDDFTLLDFWHPLRSSIRFFRLRRQVLSGRTLIINLEFHSKIALALSVALRGNHVVSLSKKGCDISDISVPVGGNHEFFIYDALAGALRAETDFAAYRNYLNSDVETENFPRLVIAPFCSNLSLRRKWDKAKWSNLIADFSAAHPEYTIAVIGSPSDRSEAQQIISGASNVAKVHNYCGETDFSAAFEIIKKSSCFCGIDSAPLHLSRLAGVPSVSLWGATDPEILTVKIEKYPEIIIFARQKCSPCVHTEKRCEIPGGCINTISEKLVFNSIEKILNGNISDRNILINNMENNVI